LLVYIHIRSCKVFRTVPKLVVTELVHFILIHPIVLYHAGY
jgi:hypothetical protein